MKNFKGIFTALLTPFDCNNVINEKALAKHIEDNIKKGVTGFYVNGSTAEVFFLSEAERKYLYQLVKDIVGDRCTLIAHIGAISPLQAIEYGKIAEQLGYDAVSAVTPFYYKFSFEEIKQYYYMIVDNVSLPMFVYNIPQLTGSALTVDNFEEFLCDTRFWGIKYTSNDFFAMEQLKTKFKDKIIYNGYDEMFLAGLSMGADGGIGGTYNIMADKFVKLKALFDNGRLTEAQEMQRNINGIINMLLKIGVTQGQKAVITLLGNDYGVPRQPQKKLSVNDILFVEKNILPLL